ncbi:hypothetical protein Tco_0540018 [Tanacetum coccineum]
MHNDIMVAGSKERPPMLAPGSYAQWKSRYMRYVDTKPNRELLRKCIYEGPYDMTLVQLEDTLLDDENQRRPESVYIILNEIGNDIYATTDACPNTKWQVRGTVASVRGTVAVLGGRHVSTSVEDLVPTPSESADLSDGESECDVPINDDSPESHFSTFDNPLFDSNDDFSSDDESLSEEEIQKDEFKYFSNPLYDLDDEIITNAKNHPIQKDLDVVIPIPPGIDERCFNAESDLLESLLNRDSPIDSTKIDSIFDEFSLPRPPEEPNSGISDATIESLSPSPIPVEDN